MLTVAKMNFYSNYLLVCHVCPCDRSLNISQIIDVFEGHFCPEFVAEVERDRNDCDMHTGITLHTAVGTINSVYGVSALPGDI